MSYSRRSRYASESRSPYDHRRSPSKSLSRSRSRSRSRASSDVENPGNNLYVTGLPARISKVKLEEHFAKEGKVTDVHLVVDPLTRESRGFGFVTMATLEDADRCLKHLDGSALEGRVITVEKARRRRGRTPTPGRYLGLRTVNVRRRSPSYSPIHRGRSRSRGYSSERSRSYSPYYRRHRSRSYSPYYRRRRSRSYYRRNRSRSYSPYHKGYRSRSPYNRYDPSPIRRRHRSYSQDSRSYTPEGCASPHYRRDYYRHSISRSTSPVGRRSSRRYYLQSVSPPRRRRSRRSYSRSVPRSYSGSGSPPHRERRRSRSCSSTKERRSRSSPSASRSALPSRRNERRHSRESYSHSRSLGSPSRSVPSRSR